MARENTPSRYKKERLTDHQLSVLETILSFKGKPVKLMTLYSKNKKISHGTVRNAVKKLKALMMVESIQSMSTRTVMLLPIYENIDIVFIKLNSNPIISSSVVADADFIKILKKHHF